MALKLSYCRYRLLFKHPFGTAHGLRDGTDSVFIRAEQDGHFGYGEATLPPYLEETVDSVIQRIGALLSGSPVHAQELADALVRHQDLLAGAPGARAALHTALEDLFHRIDNISVYQTNINSDLKLPITLMTVGFGALDEIPIKLKDTLLANGIKVKLGSPDDKDAIERINMLDNRRLFLDANQGLRSVAEVLERTQWAGVDRVLGIEQPFRKDRDDLHALLLTRTAIPVYGDESIQDLTELEAKAGAFSGVNIKLMKCGGLDRAEALIDRAQALGLKVMLGSMSESSLGCTAMAFLADRADVVDLDGPWLIKNDPFKGMSMEHGALVLPKGPGFGVTLKEELNWTPFGA